MPLVVLHPDVLADAFEGGANASNLLTVLAFGALGAAFDEFGALGRFARDSPGQTLGDLLEPSLYDERAFAWRQLRDRAPDLPTGWLLATSGPILDGVYERLKAPTYVKTLDALCALECVLDYMGHFVSSEDLALVHPRRGTEKDDATLAALASDADFVIHKRRPLNSRRFQRAERTTEAFLLSEFMTSPFAPCVDDLAGSLNLLHDILPPLRDLHL